MLDYLEQDPATFAVSPHLWMVMRDASPSIILRTASPSRLRACWTVWQQHTWLLPIDGRLCLDKLSGRGSATFGTVMITPIIAIYTFEGQLVQSTSAALKHTALQADQRNLHCCVLPFQVSKHLVQSGFFSCYRNLTFFEVTATMLDCQRIPKLLRCQPSDAASEQPLAPKPKSDV